MRKVIELKKNTKAMINGIMKSHPDLQKVITPYLEATLTDEEFQKVASNELLTELTFDNLRIEVSQRPSIAPDSVNEVDREAV